MFFCEYCEIFKNNYFDEHLQTAASVLVIMKLVVSIGMVSTNKVCRSGQSIFFTNY